MLNHMSLFHSIIIITSRSSSAPVRDHIQGFLHRASQLGVVILLFLMELSMDARTLVVKHFINESTVHVGQA